MPQVVVRAMESQDEEGFWTARSLVYNNGLPYSPEERAKPHGESFVGLVDGRVKGVFNLLEMNATRGEAVLPLRGVSAVGVSPESRRSGVGRAMMDWLPGHLKENGIPLVSLYAFREPFYRRSGYEVCGKRLRIVCPSHRLPKIKSELPVRRLEPGDWRELVPCYKEFAHARSGLHLRSEAMWARVLNENRPLAIYALGDPIEAYVAISHKVDFWVEQSVSEFVWSTRRGYEAAIQFLAQLGSNKTSLSWFEPSDSPFYARFLDAHVECRVERPIMFRVCDVPGALAQLKARGMGTFTIAVDDPQVPENRGPWRVTFDEGITVEPDTEAELEMDIQTFTQAFLGEPSLLDLAAIGLVEVRNHRSLLAAAAIMPSLPVYCMDFF